MSVLVQPVQPKKCSKCGKWFVFGVLNKGLSCTVFHEAGCCHYNDKEVQPTQGSPFHRDGTECVFTIEWPVNTETECLICGHKFQERWAADQVKR